jgi:hypothetical protein
LDSPRVFAVDTEFYKSTKHEILTEAAIVDVKTHIIVASYSSHRIMQPRELKLRVKDPLDPHLAASMHVPPVHTIPDFAEQLDALRIQCSDIFVEYSTRTHRSLDLTNIRRHLEMAGTDVAQLIPTKKEFGIIHPLKSFLKAVLPLPNWSQQLLYRVLFPRSPLVDKNHRATVDSMQLSEILRLVAELCQPPSNRRLPPDLLQGLEDLPPCSISNKNQLTLDQWLGIGGRSLRSSSKDMWTDESCSEDEPEDEDEDENESDA